MVNRSGRIIVPSQSTFPAPALEPGSVQLQPENQSREWQGPYLQTLPLWQRGWMEKRALADNAEGAAVGAPSWSARTHDLPLSDHLPGKAFTIYRELVVVHPGGGPALSVQISPVPEAAVLTASESEGVDSLARTGSECRYGDDLHE